MSTTKDVVVLIESRNWTEITRVIIPLITQTDLSNRLKMLPCRHFGVDGQLQGERCWVGRKYRVKLDQPSPLRIYVNWCDSKAPSKMEMKMLVCTNRIVFSWILSLWFLGVEQQILWEFSRRLWWQMKIQVPCVSRHRDTSRTRVGR